MQNCTAGFSPETTEAPVMAAVALIEMTTIDPKDAAAQMCQGL